MSDHESDGLGEALAAGMDRGSLLKRIAVGGAALSVPSLMAAEAALGSPQALAEAAAAVWPKHPKWKFAFINHVTTNPFFVPTQYGAADAAKMVDVSYTWGGSTKADVGEMINAFNAAISAKADGIGHPVSFRTAGSPRQPRCRRPRRLGSATEVGVGRRIRDHHRHRRSHLRSRHRGCSD